MTDISLVMAPGAMNLYTGYGQAGYGIVTSLQKLGHTVKYDDDEPEVQLNFCMPEFYQDSLSDKQKNIHLFVWESTELKEGWAGIMQDADEIWTCTEWNKRILEDQGFTVAKIYPHGVSADFKPIRKRRQGPITFLHNGTASRKGQQQAFSAFKAAFGNDMDVKLILKGIGSSPIREYDRNGSIIGYPDKNVVINSKNISFDEMPRLYQDVDAYIGNSQGEGFGLPMLESLATGTPSIVTKEWAPYSSYLGPLGLDSTYIESPFEYEHPGKILLPDFDDLVDKLRFTRNNIESLQDQFYRQAHDVHREYDWLKLTEKAFKDVL